jgi:hypothetical protein
VEASCLFYIAGDKLALALLTHYFCIFPGWKRLDIMHGFGTDDALIWPAKTITRHAVPPKTKGHAPIARPWP